MRVLILSADGNAARLLPVFSVHGISVMYFGPPVDGLVEVARPTEGWRTYEGGADLVITDYPVLAWKYMTAKGDKAAPVLHLEAGRNDLLSLVKTATASEVSMLLQLFLGETVVPKRRWWRFWGNNA